LYQQTIQIDLQGEETKLGAMKLNRYVLLSVLLTIFVTLFLMKEYQIHQQQISFADVCNMDLTAAYSQELNEESVVLQNGIYKKKDIILPSLTIRMPYAKGDFNGDLLTDYAFLIYVRAGRESYISCDLVLVENHNGVPVFIGKTQTDISDLTSLQLRYHQIILKDVSWRNVTEIFGLESGELKLLEKKVEENES
jgi:hypothetical protein